MLHSCRQSELGTGASTAARGELTLQRLVPYLRPSELSSARGDFSRGPETDRLDMSEGWDFKDLLKPADGYLSTVEEERGNAGEILMRERWRCSKGDGAGE